MEEQEQTRKGARETFSEGMRQGLGILSAFRDAIEETIQEARDRGDLSADRAKEVMRRTLDKAQQAAGDARERLDFAHQGDLDALAARVAAIEARLGMTGEAEGEDGEV